MRAEATKSMMANGNDIGRGWNCSLFNLSDFSRMFTPFADKNLDGGFPVKG
jgi:hypothetical protein